MKNLPETRAEAIAIGADFYFTGSPCKRGHLEKRRTLTSNCIRCADISLKQSRERARKTWLDNKQKSIPAIDNG